MNVESWMQTLAAQQDENGPLPTAAAIYWKAELRRRTQVRERAVLPILRMEWAASAIFVAAALAVYF